jgi:hypothetical protein
MKIILSSRKHHYLAIFSTCLITLALIAGTVSCSCSDGNGGDGDVMEIHDWDELYAIRNKPLGSYVLVEDLDASKDGYKEWVGEMPNGKGWQPIGADGNFFEGTFDGGDHTISDLFIDRPSEDNVGLFGYVLGGEIKNIKLVAVNVTGKENVGGVVGHNRGTLEYSSSTGIVKGTSYVGGLAGYTWEGTVHHSESQATVLSQSRAAGGLVGYNSLGAEILFSEYKGESVQGETEVGGLVGLNNGRVAWSNQVSTACIVTGAGYIVGGLVGLNGGVVEQSTQFGSACGKGKTGGLVGSNGLTGDVIDCHNKGDVDGNCSGAGTLGLNWGTLSRPLSADATPDGFYVGGLVGWNEGMVSNSNSTGSVTGVTDVGGLLGANWGNVTGCNSSGKVSGDSNVGRLVGYNYDTGTVSNSDSTSCVTDATNCGPLVGQNDGVILGQEIRDWYDLDAIRDNLGGSCVLMDDLDSTTAGYDELVGETVDGKGWQPIGAEGNAFKGEFDGNGHMISDLFIDRPEEDEVGLFGRVQEGLIENLGLVNVYVTGKKYVGALVGYSWKGTLDSDIRPPGSNTYSSGIVTGEENVGGLVGNNYDGIVNQCESSAEVFHASSTPDEDCWRAGGLVGLNSGTVLHCDYNGVVNGDHQVGGLVGLNEGTVENSSFSYSVVGVDQVGGLVGYNSGTVINSYSSGSVTGDQAVGCLVGLNTGTLTNCYGDCVLTGSL